MAVAFDAIGPSATGAISATSTSTTLSWSHTVGASANYLVVGLSHGAASTPTMTVTFGGVSMTQLGVVQHNATNTGRSFLFGLASPAVGAGTVAVTSTVAGRITGGSTSYSGVGPIGTAVTANSASTGTTASVAVTGTAATSVVVVHLGGGSRYTATSATQRYAATGDNTTGGGNCAGVSTAGTGGTVTTTGTLLAADWWGAIAVEVKTALPAVATLTDDFTTQDAAKWTFPGSNVSGGVCTLACLATYANVINSVSAYDLTGSSIFAQYVSTPALGTGTTEMYMFLATVKGANANSIGFYLSPVSTVQPVYRVGGSATNGTSTPYNATNHKYLRIRESGGTIFWDTSPNTQTWNNLWSATNPIAVTALFASLGTGYYGTESAPGNAVFDKVNIAEAVTGLPPGRGYQLNQAVARAAYR